VGPMGLRNVNENDLTYAYVVVTLSSYQAQSWLSHAAGKLGDITGNPPSLASLGASREP
jgi:hypothetical protein